MSTEGSKIQAPRGFFCRTSRKIRYLKHRGTLFHKTPSGIRHKARLRRRRAWRHRLLYLRLAALRRLNRYERYRNENLRTGPAGYETFAGQKPAAPVKNRPRRKLSFREKYIRFFRILRYLRTRKKLHRQKQEALRKRRKRNRLRVLFYLARKGRLFRIDRKKVGAFFSRNYSFLGRSRYLVVLLNSTVLFVLAYLFIYVAKGLATSLVANAYQIRTIISYHDINFLIRTGDWTPDKVEVVFSAGAFMSFFICLLSLIFYAKTIQDSWPVRTFLLWLMVHSFVQLFGEMLIGSILTQGFGWVIAYLFLLDTQKLLISLAAFIILVSGGLISTRYLLYSGNIYFNNLDKSSRMPFMMSQIFLPFIFGTAILIAMKQPEMSNLDTGVTLSMIFVLLPATIRARFFGNMYFDEEPKKSRVMWMWILAALLLVPAFRIIFGIGVRI